MSAVNVQLNEPEKHQKPDLKTSSNLVQQEKVKCKEKSNDVLFFLTVRHLGFSKLYFCQQFYPGLVLHYPVLEYEQTYFMLKNLTSCINQKSH